MELKELLPCPFCGGEAEHDEVDEKESQRIMCMCCGANIREKYIIDAVEAWNTRDWHKAEVKREVKKVLEGFLKNVSVWDLAEDVTNKLKELE